MNSELAMVAAQPLSVCLTDAPRVVVLKREFAFLDGREEELKRFGAQAQAREELMRVRGRKAQIAREIFGGTKEPEL